MAPRRPQITIISIAPTNDHFVPNQEEALLANIWKLFPTPPDFSGSVICLALGSRAKIALDCALRLNSAADLSHLSGDCIAALRTAHW
jgi:hypothetical protein